MNALTRPPIVAFAPGAWGWPDFAGSPRYHLWMLAGRGWPVLFVEPPRRWRWQSARWQAPDRPFHVLAAAQTPPFSVGAMPSRWVAGPWRDLAARGLVDAAMNELRVLLQLDVFDPQWPPVIAWLGAPWHGAVADRLPPAWPRVAHVYDELAASPALRPWQQAMLARWEDDLLGKCALTLCSSQPQLVARRHKSPHAVLLENAVADEFLDPGSPPDDYSVSDVLHRFDQVPRPRVVYGGVADLRVDSRVLAEALIALPEAHLVMAGARAGSFDEAPLRALGRRVHHLGLVPYAAYPHLYRGADALVLVHRLNDFTRGMFPEKLNEYLASGRPIVSVKMPEVARVAAEATMPDAIRLASNADEFAAHLRAALAEGDDAALSDERRRLARSRTWSAAADRLEPLLEEMFVGAARP